MKKMISLILCVLLFAACIPGSAFAADAKVLKVATNVAWPPYEYYEDEKAVGIDVDIIQAICDKLGYKMELIDMEFGSIITAVATGKVDVGFGAITITEERAKSVLFTTPYDSGIQAIIVKEDSKIANVEDLGAKRVIIGVQKLIPLQMVNDAWIHHFDCFRRLVIDMPTKSQKLCMQFESGRHYTHLQSAE